MPKTKICPACKQELPVLAVRCRHCGFKLSHSNNPMNTQNDSAVGTTQPIKTLTMNQAKKRTETDSPAPIVSSGNFKQHKTMLGIVSPFKMAADAKKSVANTDAAKDAQKTRSIKDESMLKNDDPPKKRSIFSKREKSSKKGETSKKGVKKNKKSNLPIKKKVATLPPTPKPAIRPSTIPKPGAPVPPGSKPLAEPKQILKPSIKPPAPPSNIKPSVPPVPSAANNNDDEWIPEIEEFSGLLELDVDSADDSVSTDLNTPEKSEKESAEKANAEKANAEKANAKVAGDDSNDMSEQPDAINKTEWLKKIDSLMILMSGYFKIVLKKAVIIKDNSADYINLKAPKVADFLKRRPLVKTADKIPENNNNFFKLLKKLVAGVTFLHLTLFVIFLIIIVVINSSGSPDVSDLAVDSVEHIDDVSGDDVSGDAIKQTAEAKDAKQIAADKKSSKNNNKTSVSKIDNTPTAKIKEPFHNCHPVQKTFDYKYKSLIGSILNQSGMVGICQLLGTSLGNTKKALKGRTLYAASGIDGLKGGEVIELYPAHKADRKSAKVSFNFYGGKLFKIKIDYPKGTSVPDVKDFKEATGIDSKKIKDVFHNSAVILKDGDVAYQWTLDKVKKNIMNSLSIYSLVMVESIKPQIQDYQISLKKVNEGDSFYGAFSYDKAAASYQSAIRLNPLCTKAYNGLAITSIKKHNYKNVLKYASETLKIATDKRTRAKAYYILSILDLVNEDKNSALDNLKKAINFDPASKYQKLSKELKTEKYPLATVAWVAAQMSCLSKISATSRQVLAENNFYSTDVFFKALEDAEKDARFDRYKKYYISTRCH